MKWPWICILFLWLGVPPAMGQYDYFVFEKGQFLNGMSVYVFSTNAPIKQRPAINAPDMVTLSHGAQVSVLSNPMVQAERGGIIHYWYQVEYTSDSGRVISGFISGHDLAMGAASFQIDYRKEILLLQITRFNPESAYTMSAKMIRNGAEIAQIRFPFIDFHGNPPLPEYSLSVLKNIQPGIDEKSEVAEISFYHANSGFPAGILYLIWNGEHLARLCETMYLLEPNLFEYDSYLVYPGRNGVKPGTVMVVETIKEFVEEQQEYILTEQNRIVYKWDGQKVAVVSE